MCQTNQKAHWALCMAPRALGPWTIDESRNIVRGYPLPHDPIVPWAPGWLILHWICMNAVEYTLQHLDLHHCTLTH